MRIVYVGNFGAPHSTENHVWQALSACGHDVTPVQEQFADWRDLPAQADGHDLVLWTHTKDYGPHETWADQRRFLADCPVPVVGYHLDLWFGLRRKRLVAEEPYFKVDMLVTADGGHQAEFEAAGVNHRWMPPAVSEFECVGGDVCGEYLSSVVFVGSHQAGYHPESRHRAALVRHLQRRADVSFWPRPGQPAVRGKDLRDLYASAGMAVGDSCLAGTGLARYWSDRIPETMGRGCLLIHPWVEGLDEHYEPGKHLLTWHAGNWRDLDEIIDHYKTHPDEAAYIAAAGREHTLANHTYTTRMRQLETLLQAEGLL